MLKVHQLQFRYSTPIETDVSARLRLPRSGDRGVRTISTAVETVETDVSGSMKTLRDQLSRLAFDWDPLD